MKTYETANIRNVCLLGGSGTGKTTCVEGIMFSLGLTTRFGSVEDGNTVSDFTDEEKERRSSLYASLMSVEYEGKVKLNIFDAPGFADFYGETFGAIYASDNAVFVLDATADVDADTETLWDECVKRGIPKIVVVNKLDKENANARTCLNKLNEKLGIQAVMFQLPIGEAQNFSGIVDVLSGKAFKYTDGKPAGIEVPADLKAALAEQRDKLIESIAAEDEKLIEKYLEGKGLTDEELQAGLLNGLRSGKIVPVLCLSSTQRVGIDQLLNFVSSYLPSPAGRKYKNKDGEEFEVGKQKELAAVVFKTYLEPHTGKVSYIKVLSGELKGGSDVYNVTRRVSERIGQVSTASGAVRSEVAKVVAGDICTLVKMKETLTNNTLASDNKQQEVAKIEFLDPKLEMAVYSNNKGEEDKLATGLAAVVQEDPTLRFYFTTETREWILSGLGMVQLDNVVKKIQARANVKIELQKPKIPYKETVKGKVEQQGKFKRQSGGKGQYGDCWLKIEPLERSAGYEFVDNISQGRIPKNYIPSIEKGIKEAMEQGIIAGYNLVDVRVTLFDGSYHEVDSSDMAFKIAGRMAMQKCVETANPTILEPIMNLEIQTPDDFVGAIMGDLNSRRGRVLGIEREGKKQVIKATVPLSEMFKYAADLRSLTKGAGQFKMTVSHLEEAPFPVRQKLIEEFKAKGGRKDEE
ncbi:MAG: elongation factor G [Elusimicrobiota bacterium]